MALTYLRPATFRLAIGVTLAGSLALVGCQTIGATEVKTATTSAGPQSVASQVAPSASTLPETPLPSTAMPVALASASVDTDLPQEDETAIETLIDSEEIKAYLPNSLIHDGGVILYQAMALQSAPLDAVATAAAARHSTCAGPTAPPDAWHRTVATVGEKQLKIRRVPGNPKQATVEIRWQDHGAINYRDLANGKAVHKQFVELNKRTMLFERVGSRWRVISLSPLSVDSQAGHSGLELQQIRMYRGKETTPVLTFDELEPLISLADHIPTFVPGESVRVEVEVRDKLACPLFVYAHLVSGTNHTRERLFDDGQSGDRGTNDGIYAGTFFVPAVAGVHHIAIDVLEPSVFTPGGVYHSNGLGMNFKVQALAPIASASQEAATPAAAPTGTPAATPTANVP
jgi:hypothetical protein